MKATITRTALAMAGMVLCLGQLQAEELSYSELEARLTKLENQIAGQNSIQQASHCCDSCCDSGCCDVGCCDACGCGNGCGCDSCCSGCCAPACGSFYAELQLLFLRAHVPENAVDDDAKLEETHEISPRFIIGYENCNGLGGRIRYWNYDHATAIETEDNVIAFDMNIVDIEATQRFQGCRSDVVLAGGVRLGNWESTDDDEDTVDNDLLGLTMAADMRSQLARGCNSELNLVGGGRMSLLGGDWDGNRNHDFIDTERDDNIFVWELYAGVEYGVCYYNSYLFTRLAYEVQMWHSAIVDSSGDLDTLGFVGPAWTTGIAF